MKEKNFETIVRNNTFRNALAGTVKFLLKPFTFAVSTLEFAEDSGFCTNGNRIHLGIRDGLIDTGKIFQDKDERISDCQPVNTADEARVVLCPFRKYKGMGIGQIASTFNGKQYIASIAGDSPLWDKILEAYPNFRAACKKFCEDEEIDPISDWGKK